MEWHITRIYPGLKMHYRNHLEAAIYCISGTGFIEGPKRMRSMSCDRTSFAHSISMTPTRWAEIELVLAYLPPSAGSEVHVETPRVSSRL